MLDCDKPDADRGSVGDIRHAVAIEVGRGMSQGSTIVAVASPCSTADEPVTGRRSVLPNPGRRRRGRRHRHVPGKPHWNVTNVPVPPKPGSTVLMKPDAGRGVGTWQYR